MNDPMFFSEHTLSSGLRVFFQSRPLNWFGAGIAVGCGQRHDPDGKKELVHLLEHCLSTGTQGLPYKTLADLQRWIAGQGFVVSLGSTSVDQSCYGGQAPVEKAEPLLRFLHDLVLRPTLGSGLDHEREIIRNERRESSSPRGRKIEERRNKAVFGSHALADKLGWADDATLDRLTIRDVRKLHRSYYDSRNMAIVVIGGLEEKRLIDALEGLFTHGRVAYEAPPRPQPIAFDSPKPRSYRSKKPGSKASSVVISYYWHMAPPRRSVLALCRNILCDALMERVRDVEKAAYDVDVDNEPWQDHEIVTLRTEVAPRQVEKVCRIIEATLADPGAIAAELDRARQKFLVAASFMEMDVGSTLSKAVSAISLYGRPKPVTDGIAEYAKVTPDDIRAFMAEHLTPEKAYLELIEQ